MQSTRSYRALGWFAVILTLVGVFLLRSETLVGLGFLLLLTGITLGVSSAIQRSRIQKQILKARRESLHDSLGELKVDTDRLKKNLEDVERSYEAILAMRCDSCGASFEVERQLLKKDPQRGYYDAFHLKCTSCGRKRVYESDLPHLEGMAWYEKPGDRE